MVHLEISDIQGIIVTGYGYLIYSSYIFLHIDDPERAKVWLNKIVPQITSGKWDTESGEIRKPDWALNIAFTYKGLSNLGLSDDSLESFAEEFIQGISEKVRSDRFGDTGDSEPKNWEVGGPQTLQEDDTHILLIVQTATPTELQQLSQTHIDLAASLDVRQVGAVEYGYLPLDAREHFGFHDAISQPNVEGSPRKTTDNQPLIKAGEFILGYLNEYNQLPSTPTVATTIDVHKNLQPLEESNQLKDLGRNGSYMVFRKLYQDVAAFRRYFRDNFSDPVQRELVAAKFVGRWPDGTSLVVAPQSNNDPSLKEDSNNNNFYYANTDPHGYGCPMGAHIRRVNPRDSLGTDCAESIKTVNRHRLIRRGALYGDKLPQGVFEDDGKPRGVLFFCINSDIKRQFEFVQQTWINNHKFNGLYDEKDPLLGDNDASGCMTIQQEPVRWRVSGISRFVTVKGGAYFFLPSISALYFLAGVKNPR